MTSANPNPRPLLTTLMEENPDATEQELFESVPGLIIFGAVLVGAMMLLNGILNS